MLRNFFAKVAAHFSPPKKIVCASHLPDEKREELGGYLRGCNFADYGPRYLAHAYAASGDVGALERLIQKNPDALHEKDWRGQTLGHVAAHFEQFHILNVLDIYGLDFSLMDKKGRTARDLVLQEKEPNALIVNTIIFTMKTRETPAQPNPKSPWCRLAKHSMQ